MESQEAWVGSVGDGNQPGMPVVSSRVTRWQTFRRKATRFHEVAKFGAVGGACYLVDVGVFNLAHAVLHTGPLEAKTISTIIAGSCAYVGNRHWSFTDRARTGVRREYSLFIALNAVGLGIALACLGFTKYVLGMDGTLAVNISGNVIGTGLGTIFRFWAYKRFVFLRHDHPKVTVTPAAARRPAVAAGGAHGVARLGRSHGRESVPAPASRP
jgi:putative flippase GtrA